MRICSKDHDNMFVCCEDNVTTVMNDLLRVLLKCEYHMYIYSKPPLTLYNDTARLYLFPLGKVVTPKLRKKIQFCQSKNATRNIGQQLSIHTNINPPNTTA